MDNGGTFFSIFINGSPDPSHNGNESSQTPPFAFLPGKSEKFDLGQPEGA